MKPRQQAQPRGRPRVGIYRLQTMLPQNVLDALKHAERADGVYRTRIAANVLCEWANKQQPVSRFASH